MNHWKIISHDDDEEHIKNILTKFQKITFCENFFNVFVAIFSSAP